MKLCINCKHFEAPNCRHQNNVKKSMVTGELLPLNSPHYLRQIHSSGFLGCEPVGRWWEPAANYADMEATQP